ncbi:MAG: YeiH family putative sulfate export transporter [Campylobacteraceae bacterium]|nr:YeiH family putative sulfate export transporter [Campylobacteraceae bacterium]
MLKIAIFTKDFIPKILYGLSLVALFAFSATLLSEVSWFKELGLSPLIIGIVLGIIYANTLKVHLPQEYSQGIIFSTKKLLRIAIVFYGFRITYQSIFEVGMSGFIAGALIVTLTFTLGYFIGVKLLKLDLHTTILISAGSSICGAAAVLATESVLKSEAYKTAIAVSSVVVFGSILMFLHPFLYKMGYINLDQNSIGIYLGATLHEVANVVAAGNTLGEDISNDAVIVKMIRVMMLAPFLIFLGLFLKNKTNIKNKKATILVPWFALYFIGVAGFNSLEVLPYHLVQSINEVDTFLLTMSMCALGMETSFSKFKNVGLKPLYLSTILFVWLIIGGFYITKLSMSI